MRDKLGRTALIHAAMNGHYPVVAFLLNKGECVFIFCLHKFTWKEANTFLLSYKMCFDYHKSVPNKLLINMFS